MAKNDAKETQGTTGQFKVTLDEFCMDLSKTDRRTELIGGFHFDEKKNGRVRDTSEAYAKRFLDFTNAPA